MENIEKKIELNRKNNEKTTNFTVIFFRQFLAIVQNHLFSNFGMFFFIRQLEGELNRVRYTHDKHETGDKISGHGENFDRENVLIKNNTLIKVRCLIFLIQITRLVLFF